MDRTDREPREVYKPGVGTSETHAGGRGMQTVQAMPTNPVVRLFAEIDMASAIDVARELRPYVEAGGPVVVDLSGVTFMDSSGIAVLVEAAQALGDRGCMIVHGAHQAGTQVISVLQLERLAPNIHVIECDVLVEGIDAEANPRASAWRA
jgi:anti-anti-sigma factor